MSKGDALHKEVIRKSNMRQYILTGAGLGLYFGYFFRPSTEPSIVSVVGLSLLITIVMTCIRLWKREREQLLRFALMTWLNYAAILAVLAGRHYALAIGGKSAVIAMTTIFGALAGYRMALKEERA